MTVPRAHGRTRHPACRTARVRARGPLPPPAQRLHTAGCEVQSWHFHQIGVWARHTGSARRQSSFKAGQPRAGAAAQGQHQPSREKKDEQKQKNRKKNENENYAQVHAVHGRPPTVPSNGGVKPPPRNPRDGRTHTRARAGGRGCGAWLQPQAPHAAAHPGAATSGHVFGACGARGCHRGAGGRKKKSIHQTQAHHAHTDTHTHTHTHTATSYNYNYCNSSSHRRKNASCRKMNTLGPESVCARAVRVR